MTPIHRNPARQVVAESVYTHDAVGNRLSKATGEDKETRYGYDAIYRLLSARPVEDDDDRDGDDDDDDEGDSNGHGERYSYDPVGNRLAGPQNHEHQPGYIYDAANRLLEDHHYRYQYDRNGNLIAKTGKGDDDDDEEESWSYRYDFENRLVEVVKRGDDGAITVTFAYDPMGRRVEKKVLSREEGKWTTRLTRYLYDNEDILLETDAAGKVTNRYLHGPGIDEPLALVQGKYAYYYHADGLGSIVVLTDSKGKVAQEYQYDSFGNLHDQSNRIKQPYTYTGREWDRETGLYYYRARYYDAKSGRFISEDPIGFDGGINQFTYTDNNPVNAIDPMGLAKMFCRNLGSIAGSVFKKKHCYIVADNGTKYGLYPSGNMLGGALIGVPVINDPRDIGGQCFNCPAKDCEDQNNCLEKAHNKYPIGVYRLLGPNSNTYAGTLARSCCKDGVPAGVNNAPGINDSPPKSILRNISSLRVNKIGNNR